MGRPRKHPLRKPEQQVIDEATQRLVAAVQDTVATPPPPPMSDAEGEKTPAYLDWLAKYKPDEYAEKMKRWGRTIQ